MIQMLHLKIEHHFLHESQKLMMNLLVKRIIFTLQCLCTIWLNTVIIIQTHQEVYGSLKKVKFQIIMLIWLLIVLTCLNITVVGKTADAVSKTNSSAKNAKILVSLKYPSNFWRSLEIPLINCKIHLKLICIEKCISLVNLI